MGVQKGFHLQGSKVSTQLQSVCKYVSPGRGTFVSLPQEVDLYHSGSIGIRNPKGRVKTGVHNSTRTKAQRNKCTKVWYSRVGYFNRNKHVVRKKCYRTCTCQSRERRILQHHFCGAKETRRASDNLEFKTFKPVNSASTFQNGDTMFNYESI